MPAAPRFFADGIPNVPEEEYVHHLMRIPQQPAKDAKTLRPNPHVIMPDAPIPIINANSYKLWKIRLIKLEISCIKFATKESLCSTLGAAVGAGVDVTVCVWTIVTPGVLVTLTLPLLFSTFTCPFP